MDIEKALTTEALRKMKPDMSIFDLVSYSIKRAQNMIDTGRDSYVRTESQSRATQILAEIATGKDFLDEFEDEEDEEEERKERREFRDLDKIANKRADEQKEMML